VNRRKHWHQACADRWRIMNDPTEARKFVWQRDNGICQECGRDCKPSHPEHYHSPCYPWQVDHVKALFEANGDISYYEPENMELLCDDCHKLKTKEDARRYRLLQDIVKNG